jgi:tetratricopeptide (TPR) repeat protein
MTDEQCSKTLASLLSMSNRNAVLGMHSNMDKVKTMATQLLEDNQIFQRDDSWAYSMRLEYARILHNRGLLNDAAAIQQSVLYWRRQHKEKEHPRLLVEALTSYAQSLTALGSVIKSRKLLEEGLDICKASFEPGSTHILDCKEALAALHDVEGNTKRAIEIIKEVLRIRQGSPGNTKSQIIGTMSDLAVYLALASRWKDSWETICLAVDFAKESLRYQDVVNLSVDLNASTLSGLMRIPVTERNGRVVALGRGGRVIATLNDERTWKTTIELGGNNSRS